MTELTNVKQREPTAPVADQKAPRNNLYPKAELSIRCQSDRGKTDITAARNFAVNIFAVMNLYHRCSHAPAAGVDGPQGRGYRARMRWKGHRAEMSGRRSAPSLPNRSARNQRSACQFEVEGLAYTRLKICVPA